MNPQARAPSPLADLVADLEKAARILPRASAEEAEALVSSLSHRLETLGPGSRPSAPEVRRASRALSAFHAAVSVMRTNTDARLGALLHASRPPAGYTGNGRFATAFDRSLRGAA